MDGSLVKRRFDRASAGEPLNAWSTRSVASAVMVAVALLVAAGPAAHAAPPAHAADPGVALVVLAPGVDAGDVARDHAATLKAFDAAAGVASLRAPRLGALLDALAEDPRVLAAEADGRVRTAGGATSNGAGWDGVGWAGTGWAGTGWAGAGWDGAGWDGAGWDGAGWDGVGWASNEDYGAAPIPPWGLLAIGAEKAWESGTPQQNRIVCIVDSGLDVAHPVFQGRLWSDASGRHGRNLIAGDHDLSDPGGHGTHMAGIVAAQRGNGLGFAGVAAPLVAAAKVIGPDGTGATSDAIAGITWCSDIRAHVILLAWSESSPTSALMRAVNGAQQKGALVVASAGNHGPCDYCVSYPAAYRNVLTVGAVDEEKRVPGFSAKGGEVDLVAPGRFITSAYPGGGARVGSGTSQAAAFAAGAAAFVWGKEPSWSAWQVQEHLRSTAEDHGMPGTDRESGFGILRLDRAVASLPAR